MDCPNCGEKLRDANQNFCPNCGSEISTIFETPQLRTEREQYASTPSSQLTLESSSSQIIVQKEIKNPFEGPGVHSKRCLAFSIISLALTFPFWANVSFSFFLLQNDPFIDLGIIRPIVIIIASGVGLGFGIFAKTNSSDARKLEPQNNLEEVGSVLAIIGMVINTLPIVCYYSDALFIRF